MSSIAEVKSLLAQLRTQLGSAAGVSSESQQAFAALCGEARARLAECESLQRAGQLEAAVRLAEQEPELLELADRLARLESAPAWAGFASRSGLPEVPALGAGTAERLLGLYRSWDRSSELLWRKYRDTMMRRDEEAAVIIAQRIFRIDPRDHDARDEVNRVGRRMFKEKLKQLEEDLACGDEAAAVRLAAQLDSVPFDDLKTGAAWEAAIKLRDRQQRATNEKALAGLLAALPGLRESGDLDELERLVSKSEEMLRRLGLDPGQGQPEIAESKRWVAAELERRQLAAKLRAAVERCRGQVTKIESNWKQLKSGPTSEAETALRKLGNCWSEVERAGTDPGSELRQKVASLRRDLEAKLRRDSGRGRRRALLAKAAIIALACAASYYLYAQWRGGRIVDQLVQLQSERKALAVKAVLDRAERWSWPVIALARIRPEVDKSHAWSRREDDHRKAVAATTAELEAAMVEDFEGPATVAFHAKIAALQQDIADAAVDLQPGLNQGGASLFKAWDDHVAAFVADRQQKRESLLAEINETLDNLPELSVAGRDAALAPQLAARAADLDKWSQATIPQAAMRPEIAEQVRKLDAPLQRTLESLDVFRNALQDLRNATKHTAYLAAIGRFSRAGQLIQTPEHAAAAALLDQDLTELKVVGQVLAPADPAGWDWFIAHRQQEDFFPASIEESERKILKGLAGDPNLSGIFSCRFRTRPSGRTFDAFSSGPPVEHRRRAGSSFHDHRGNFFDGTAFRDRTFSLESGRGDELVSMGLSAESALLDQIRPVENLMSQSQQYYQRGLIPVFEQITTAGNTEPLFRAYLQSKLGSILLRRPDQWGSVLSPHLIADLQELQELGARSLVSSAWMTPDLIPERNQLFSEFYARAGDHRYALEAQLNRALIGHMLDAGVTYAGFIDLDGSPVLVPGIDDAAVELYGHADPKLPARLLLRRAAPAAGTRSWEKLEAGAPLTALIAFKADRSASLAAAAAELGISPELARSRALAYFAAP